MENLDSLSLLGPSLPSIDRAQAAEVKAWFREALSLDEGVVISLSQLRCADAHCPDIETVIAVLPEGQPRRAFKIWLPVERITQSSVRRAIRRASQPPNPNSTPHA